MTKAQRVENAINPDRIHIWKNNKAPCGADYPGLKFGWKVTDPKDKCQECRRWLLKNSGWGKLIGIYP